MTFDEVEVEWMRALDLDDDADDDDRSWTYDEENDDNTVDDVDDMVSNDDDCTSRDCGESQLLEVLYEYNVEDTIFATGELEKLRTKDQILMERKDKSYYHSKAIHSTVYDKITSALKTCITRG